MTMYIYGYMLYVYDKSNLNLSYIKYNRPPASMEHRVLLCWDHVLSTVVERQRYVSMNSPWKICQDAGLGNSPGQSVERPVVQPERFEIWDSLSVWSQQQISVSPFKCWVVFAGPDWVLGGLTPDTPWFLAQGVSLTIRPRLSGEYEKQLLGLVPGWPQLSVLARG